MTNDNKQQWTNPNRDTSWGRGPWDQEPDKQQWVDEATGLDCLAVRNNFGNWCGYVGVLKDHPCFGKADSAPVPELAALHAKRMKSPMPDIFNMNLALAAMGGKLDELTMGVCLDVHGGVTFAAGCHEHDDSQPWRYVCHVPRAGRDEVWWVGFDCAHAGDLSPSLRIGFNDVGDVYRTLPYVEEQCASLAAQLASVTQ